MKGFKYHIIVKVLLRKYRKSGDTKFVPVYFKSVIKTVILNIILTNRLKNFYIE